jgi:signal transduction histidine kinase
MKNQSVQADERLKAIFEHVPTGLAEIDPTGSVIHMNQKAKTLLKPVITSINFDDNNFFPVLARIGPGITEKINALPQKTGVLTAGEIHHFTVSNNGTTEDRSFQFTITRLSAGSVIIAFDDISDKNINERTIPQLVLDIVVEQEKFNFCANVLHDIGNAVVGFGSYVNRIKRSVEETNPEDLQNLAGFFETKQTAIAESIGEDKAGALSTMLKTMAAAQKSAHEIIGRSVTEQLNIITHIQEILTIQRQYVNGDESHENIPTHLRGIINDCMSMLFASIEKRGIILTLNVPLELPAISCNRTRLMQVILNILKNSIEAIDVYAEKKVISLNVFTLEDMLVLQVQDSGSGFDEVTRGKLFARGFTTKSSGTGLGLSSCRDIIESFNGGIDITSDGPGKGALTSISFKI